MGNSAGVRRDFAALEERRMEAARLLRTGLSQSEVARKVGVHRQSVSRWADELEHSGVRGLRKAERTGRPPKLSAAQLRDIERALKRGPESFGFTSGLWSAIRVRELIEQRTGVRYHEDHVWRILRSSTGVASVLPDEHWNATSKRLGAGRSTAGRRLKKSAPRKAHHRLRRRERTERTPTSGADLGAARTDSGPAVPLHLESAVGRGRDHLVELLLPALSPYHPRRRSRRLPRPSAASLARQAVGGVGRTAGASRTRCQRVHRRARWPTRGRTIAGLRTGTQSGGVYLGLLEASRITQLLSSRFYPAQSPCSPHLVAHASSTHPGDGVLGTGGALPFVTILCRTQ